jgi:hypothetical protein
VARTRGGIPVYEREVTPQAPRISSRGIDNDVLDALAGAGLSRTRLKGPIGAPGMALSLIAETTKLLAVDALARQAKQVEAEAPQQGRSAGITAALEGQPLPRATNASSAGARAYDAGAATGYAAGVSNRLRAGLVEISARHEADPEGFAAEAQKFRESFAFVPDELRGDLDLDWGEAFTPLHARAEALRSGRIAEANALEVRSALDGMRIGASAAARTGDAGRLAELVERGDLLLEASILDGSLTAPAAAEYRRMRDAEIRQHSALGQFDEAFADGLEAAKGFRADFAQTWDELGLSADERDAIDARMGVLIGQREAEIDRAQARAEAQRREQLQRLTDDVGSLGRVAAVTGDLPSGWGEAKQAAGRLDPTLSRRMDQLEEDLAWGKDFRKLPPGERLEELRRLERQAQLEAGINPAAAEAIAERVKHGREVHAEIGKQAEKAPLATAEATGAVQPTPLDPSTDQTTKDSFRRRELALDATARHEGKASVPPFRGEEVTAIVDAAAAAADARGKLETVRRYVMGFSSDALRRRAIAQLEEEGKLPEAYRPALDVYGPSGPAKAEAVLADLLAKAEPEDTGLKKATEAAANTAYDQARGSALLHAAAYTGATALVDAERADALTVAKSRAATGARDPAGAAVADLYGHERAIDRAGFAHLVVPKSADPDLLARGLAKLRREGAAMTEYLPLPPPAPGQADLREGIRARLTDQVRRAGVWINVEGGFVLMVPGTRMPLADASGKPWVVGLDDVLAAGEGEPSAADETRRRIAEADAAAGYVQPDTGSYQP